MRKKLSKIGKSFLSVVLCLTMLLTTFCFFDIGSLISEAVVDVNGLVNTVEPTVKFYVPETIYLNPVIGSGTQKYSFQYFIDCDETGSLRRSATQTSGTVYFSCSSAWSSMSISWENTTITSSATNTSTNQIFKQTITGGTTSVSDGRVKVTCTYVVGGVTYYAYAYTYMYYPDLDLLTGAVGSYVYKTSIGNEPKLAAFSFITGVHYVGNTTTYTDEERGVSNYYDQYNTSSSKGAFGLSPLIPNWSSTAQFKTADGDAYINDRDIIYGEKTVGNSKFIVSGNGGVYFRGRQRDGSTEKYIGNSSTSWGVLYVDTSRVTNYNQIPNLRGGFICHYYENSSAKGKLESFQSDDSTITIMSNIDYRNGDGKGYGMTSSDALKGTPENKTYTMRGKYTFERSNSSTVHFYEDFGLQVNTVNKGSLRSLYIDVIELGWQLKTSEHKGWSSSVQSSWTSAYNTFASALDTAGTILGKPYATASEVTSAYDSLNNAKTACDNIVNSNFTGGINSDLQAPAITFYVPETIYLTPSISSTNTFKYYVDRNTSSNNFSLRTGEQTSGNIYFNCSKATSVKSITLSDTSSVTIGETSSSNGTLETTITGGTLSSALSPGTQKTLTWTIVYVSNGVEFTAYAYTVAYAPWPTVISASACGRYNSSYSSRKTAFMITTWISGVHSVVDNGSGGKGSGVYKYSPLYSSSIPAGSDQNMSNLFNSGSGGSGHYDKDDDTTCNGGRGLLTVDTSRYSNYNTIPNFKIGLDCNYAHGNGQSGKYSRLGYYTTGSYSDAAAKLGGEKETSGDNSVRNIFFTTMNRTVSDSTEDITVRGFAESKGTGNGSTRYSYAHAFLTVNKANKSSLRSTVNSFISKGLQKSWYTDDTWNSYETKLKTMMTNLCDPTSTDTSGATELAALEASLVRKSGTVTAVHKRHPNYGADYNGASSSAIIGTVTESKSYSLGDIVYGYYNEIPGFTKSNYSVTYGSTTKSSGVPQDNSNNNYYYIKNINTANVDWTFYYTPNTYNITYNPNGGTYNGTTGTSSTTVLFQSKYIVGNLGGSTPSNPTRTGCTFAGWKCSSDGMVYNTSDAINWEFAEDVTFTAQWTYNPYYTFYNENHDGLAANLFTPDLSDDFTYTSTASDGTACSLTVSQIGNGTVKLNGNLAGSVEISKMPFKVEAGKTYTVSSEYISGGCNWAGCCVIEITNSSYGNTATRKNLDFRAANASKTYTFTADDAAEIGGYKFWVWHNTGAGTYISFDNLIVKLRIEESGTRTSSDIFSDYLQYGGTYESLPTPYREGYTFDGWFTAASGGTQVKVGSATPYKNTTLYAHWTINNYKLTYDNEFDFDNFDFINSTYPKTSGGSTLTVNEKENSISFTSSTGDDYTRTGQEGTPASTGYMTLVPGHTYEISYSYTVSQAAALNCYIFAYTSTDSTSWSGDYNNTGTGTYYNIGTSTSGATSGTTTGTYKVPAGRPYEKLRFGTTTQGTTVKFYNIIVRDLTDPMNYKASDGVNPSLDKTSDTVTFKATQSPLATISRQGYTFKGWFQSLNTSNGNGYGTQYTTSNTMPARDVPLFAQWALNDYQIVINLNADSTDNATIGSFNYNKANNTASTGAIALSSATSAQQTVTGNIATINVAYGTSFTLPIPSRNGFTFVGWSASATPNYASLTNNGNSSASSYRVGAGGVTLTAQWKNNSYNVTYDFTTNGGTSATKTSAVVDYRSAIDLSPTATKAGWEFVGWNTNKDATTALSSLTMSTNDVTLYAIYKKTLTANFYSGINKATNNPRSVTIWNTATSATVTSPTTYTSVWSFVGWTTATTVTSSTAYIGTGVSVTITASQGTVNYYALYKQLHTLVYDANGGSGAPANTATYGYYNSYPTQQNGQHTVSSTVPTRTGYTFGGWNTNSSGTGTNYTAGQTFTNNASTNTLYAKWTANKLTIKYNGNGSTSGSMPDQSFTYDQAQNLTSNGFAKQYTITLNGNGGTINGSGVVTDTVKWSFNGWNSAANGSGAYSYTNGQSVTNPCGISGNSSSATLYAQWSTEDYTLKTAVKDGYTLVGWADSASADKPTYTVNQTFKFTSDKTFYAVWVETATANERVREFEVVTGITVTKKDLTYETIATTEKKYVYVNDETYSALCEAYDTAYNNFVSSKTTANASALVDARKNLDSYSGENIDEKFKYDAPIKDYINNFEIDFASGVSNLVTPGRHNLSEINLNHYTDEILGTSDISILKQLEKANAVTSSLQQNVINDAVKQIAKDYITFGEANSNPSIDFYETPSSVAEMLGSSSDVEAVNYVYSGKGGYTYYCYVNSKTPTVVLNAVENSEIATVIETSSTTSTRTAYPTRATVTSSGGASTVTTKHVDSSDYSNYISKGIGSNYSGYVNGELLTGENYYSAYSQIKLTPVLSTDRQEVVYTIKATDDALVKTTESNTFATDINYAATANMSGTTANNSAKQTTTITDPTAGITICFCYHDGSKNGLSLGVNAKQYELDVYLNQYHLERTSGGASNWELPQKGDSVYTVYDNTYGQKDYGSFTYTFTYTSGAANNLSAGTLGTKDTTTIIELLKNTSNYNSMKSKTFVGANKGGDGLGYQVWGTNWSFSYYPQSKAYTYVHLVDRWGNTYDNVFALPSLDYGKVTAASTGEGYTILEEGGSGIDTLSLNSSSFEILADEVSTIENDVFTTQGNTVRISTGEANKAYTLKMTDKATNSSTATVKSNENGIITLSVEDTAYESGVYTFMLNSIEVNLYDGAEADKYVLGVTGDEVDEGETAQITVTTKGDVSKLRFTDASGNTSTVSSFVQNEDGTRTWTFAKARPAGEYTYKITVKVGHEWLDEGDTAALIFNERILDSGKVRSAEYDEETGLYKVTFEGRATKVQFVSEDGMTRTYTRYAEAVKSIKTYDADGNEVNDTARTLDHEVWYVEARLYSGQNYTVAGKFEAGWNRAEDSTSTVTGK